MSEKVGLLFVGGAPRSGTTLVQRVLNSHPEIYGGPEFDFISDLMDLHYRMQNSVGIGRISEYFDSNQLNTHFEHFIKGIFEDKAMSEGVSVISEKTPRNAIHFEEILNLFSDSKVVFVVRDPRAIYNSMKKVRNRTKKIDKTKTGPINPSHFIGSLYSAAGYIQKCFDNGSNVARKYPERVLVVKYEELVDHPERETKKLAEFLGLSWVEDMMNPNSQKFDNPRSGESNNPWYSKEKRNRNIEKSDKTKWKDQLSSFEKKYINRRLNKYLNEYSYEIENELKFINSYIYESLIKGYIITYDVAKVLYAHFIKKNDQ
jgi:hypothetical protein